MYLKLIYDVLRYSDDEIVHETCSQTWRVFYLEILKCEKRLMFLRRALLLIFPHSKCIEKNGIMRLHFGVIDFTLLKDKFIRMQYVQIDWKLGNQQQKTKSNERKTQRNAEEIKNATINNLITNNNTKEHQSSHHQLASSSSSLYTKMKCIM